MVQVVFPERPELNPDDVPSFIKEAVEQVHERAKSLIADEITGWIASYPDAIDPDDAYRSGDGLIGKDLGFDALDASVKEVAAAMVVTYEQAASLVPLFPATDALCAWDLTTDEKDGGPATFTECLGKGVRILVESLACKRDAVCGLIAEVLVEKNIAKYPPEDDAEPEEGNEVAGPRM